MSIHGWQGSSPTEYGRPMDDSYLWDGEYEPDATEARRCLGCGRFFSVHPESERLHDYRPGCRERAKALGYA
jgi:hypothetical protein